MVTTPKVMKNLNENVVSKTPTHGGGQHSTKKSRVNHAGSAKKHHSLCRTPNERLHGESGHAKEKSSAAKANGVHPHSHPRVKKSQNFAEEAVKALMVRTPNSKKSLDFGTPPRASRSSTSSPKLCFAGSKCYEPPTPESLPKPPSEWISSKSCLITNPFQTLVSSLQEREQRLHDSRDTAISELANQHLKTLLKVNA